MNGMQPVVNCKPCCCFIFLFSYYVTDPVSPWLVAVAKNWHGRLFNEPALQLMQLLNLNASSKPTQVQEIICLFVCLSVLSYIRKKRLVSCAFGRIPRVAVPANHADLAIL
jgi:hypothetical protein